MSDARLPRAAEPFVTFAPLLRAHGFAVAPEQTIAFLTAVGLLGPRSIADVRRAAHATLAPAAEQQSLFDHLFEAHFLGVAVPVIEPAAADEEAVRFQEESAGGFDPPDADELNETGEAATAAEALSRRALAAGGEADLLHRLARALPRSLPRRRGYRLAAAAAGRHIDLRRLLRIAVRNDGEVVELPVRQRKTRQRSVLVLIDVSGSMKQQSDANLRLAHVLTQRADRCEVLTFGTRLSRITRALRLKRRDQALAAAAATVSDWDGGTRIGDALHAFLAMPRFAGYARGALVIVLSDGLERGDHGAMTAAVARLARRAWRLVWLTPMAADPGFRPETAALKSILPFIDHLGDGSSTARIVGEMLALDLERAA
jgi:hypothetical protein